MLREFNKDRIALVKSDGRVVREDIPALVTGKTVFTSDQTLPLEVGDHLLRKLPNGLVEDYEVVDPKFYNVGEDSHFQIDVRKAGLPKQQATIIHGITNNFTGANSRVNINSVDKSTNISTSFSPEALLDFVGQVRPLLSHLPEDSREVVDLQLTKIEEEVSKPSASKLNILAALQSIKAVAEAASGNLVAVGIIQLISALL